MGYQTALFLHAAATFFMVGLIWVIQCVQYPLFLKVGRADFQLFHAEYVQRIGWVVGVMMPVEMGFAGYLFLSEACSGLKPWAGAGLGCLALIWGITAFVQAPQHQRLKQGYDTALIRRLAAGNWARTLLWTIRAVLALIMLGIDCI
ncbi:MAG TPA: hypothetical protein PLY88_04545 [Candidatus Omnitrophota bacterium]|nr:hypothetical protein [Candidatus Omnitrophota bacterium]HRK61802.1 hypothetical protein [Candidatus Omnitrophota bacterium]